MPSLPLLNNYNSSQKITEKNGNNKRNSVGLLNNLVGKVDKSDKNLKNTQNLKGSYSITNFQAAFQATIPPPVQLKHGIKNIDDDEIELRSKSLKDLESHTSQTNKGNSVLTSKLSGSSKNLKADIMNVPNAKIFQNNSNTPTTTGGHRSNPHQTFGLESASHKRSHTKDPFES